MQTHTTTDDSLESLLDHPPVDRPTVCHCRRDAYDVYIGRGDGEDFATTDDPDQRGYWGNPTVLPHDCSIQDRREAVATHRMRVVDAVRPPRDPDGDRVLDELRELAGQRLGCWCRDADEERTPATLCHGDALADLVEHAVRGTFDGPADPERWAGAAERAIATLATTQIAMDRSQGMAVRDACHAVLLAAHRHPDPPTAFEPDVDAPGGDAAGDFVVALQMAAGDVADRRDDRPDDYRADVFAVARALVADDEAVPGGGRVGEGVNP